LSTKRNPAHYSRPAARSAPIPQAQALKARQRPPTSFEDLLGDAIERAFGQGHWELDGLVAYLNKSGPAGPNGQPWTAESFQQLMTTLGA
jgi:hypothetical protein